MHIYVPRYGTELERRRNIHAKLKIIFTLSAFSSIATKSTMQKINE